MIMDMNEHIKAAIADVVRERLSSETVRILDVKVMEDADDDDTYSVLVIYDAPKGVLDPDATIGLVRHTRSRVDAGNSMFPIFRFVSQSDAKKIGIAAA